LVGRISDVLVDEGDRGKLGQVIAHLAPEQLNTDVHVAASGVPREGRERAARPPTSGGRSRT
jgi:multidrug efflux pump subunit AcrA (membrane-fusion protein)